MLNETTVRKNREEKRKNLFWSKILEQDIDKQSNFVALMTLIGLVAFCISLVILWTVKVNITIPAESPILINIAPEEFVVEAKISENYSHNIKERQRVNIKFLSVQNEKFYASGEIIEVRQQNSSEPTSIKVKPNLDVQTLKELSQHIRSMGLRVIIDRKNLISLFFEKQLQ